MALDHLVEVATVFDATPEELERSGIPDDQAYTVWTFGYVNDVAEKYECHLDFSSGILLEIQDRKDRTYWKSCIRVYEDNGSDWARSPGASFRQKLAAEVGGAFYNTSSGPLIVLPERLTQAQIATHIRNWKKYFEDENLYILQVQYRNVPSSILDESLFGKAGRWESL